MPRARAPCHAKKDLDKRVKDHMERNLITPTKATIRAILMSGFECEDSFLEIDVESTARKVIEKAADNATIDYSQEPVRWGNPQELTVLENQDSMMTQIKPLQDAKEQHYNQIASLQQKVESLKSDVIAPKATTESYFAVRSRFFLPYFFEIRSVNPPGRTKG